MLLHRLHLDPRSRGARRDLADPYQMHSTLCRAFSASDERCSPGAFLWRLEPESSPDGLPRVIVQSRLAAAWNRIDSPGWLARVDPPLDLDHRLGLRALGAGRRFRFRLRGNPCVTRNGKRLGLMRAKDQEAWLARKGDLHGFAIPLLDSKAPAEEPGAVRYDVLVSQERLIRGNQRSGNNISVFSALYDGFLQVTDPDRFRAALANGVGHGKALGLGLLSVIPVG